MASKRRSRTKATRNRRTRRRLWWDRLPQEELLDVRLCDLDLSIEGTAIEARFAQLHDELDRAGLRFRPHVWLSTDWFTPDGVTGFAIPFFLAHPRLFRLEHRQMLEVEGGNHDWCMKLMRHETGHALDNAYRLHWKKRWRETFGSFSEKYAADYAPDPESRHHVQHLGFWYSQSHPAEDWAECFAVWLAPGSRWRTAYRDWPVTRKLRYVDEQMAAICDQKPVVACRARPDSLPTLKQTLRDYYRDKKGYYRDNSPEVIDEYLLRLFARHPSGVQRASAATFLRRFQSELRNRVAHLTKQPKYLVQQALHVVIVRCRELGLHVIRPTAETRVDATILITILTMRFVHGRRPRYRR